MSRLTLNLKKVFVFHFYIQLIDSLVDGTSRSGIAIADNSSENVIDSLKYAIDDRGLQK